MGYLSQVGNYQWMSRSFHNDGYQLFQAMIKELRREKGVTQEALAESLGMPQSYVSKYELGERRLDLIETFEICRALNTDFVAFVQKFAKYVESRGGRGITNPRNNRHDRR